MGFRFYKRINILPGLSLNLSNSGPSLSFGPKGLKYTVGSKGTRTTFGIPGTGIYYTSSQSYPSKRKSTSQNANHSSGKPLSSNQNPSISVNDDQLSFFNQLFLSGSEKSLHRGLLEFAKGNTASALNYFLQGTDLIDCSFMAGFIHLGQTNYSRAEQLLQECNRNNPQLGQSLRKLNKNVELLLDITEYIEAPIQIDQRGLGLTLTEVYQHQDKFPEALATLERLWDSNPSDKVVCLSLTDLIALSQHSTTQHVKDVIEVTRELENDEPIDTNILYLRAYGLYRLGLKDSAITQLSAISRKNKDRPKSLMLDIRYLRGQIYEEIGESSKAKKDYEFIFAENPGYEDVANRLGL